MILFDTVVVVVVVAVVVVVVAAANVAVVVLILPGSRWHLVRIPSREVLSLCSQN